MTVSTAALVLVLGLVAGWMQLAARRQIAAARCRAQGSADLHLATIEALARAIDAKDQSAEHMQRVLTYVRGLAGAVGVAPADLKGIETAALLHDIGTLAVPEHILSKPGPLTVEEFQKVRSHSQVGADILASVPFPYPVASVIRSHHERWDGTGYPVGLKGEEIPIGARILTVVDYFDAVTTDRPYHKALSVETGMALLQHEAGKALDPTLVAAFVDLVPWFSAQSAGRSHRHTGAPAGVPAATPAHTPNASRQVFDNIALAHRELCALYEIAQSMGTSLGVAETMALVSSKIANIVPWSSCALFLHDGASDTVTCRYATGTEAPQLLGRTLGAGEGLSGWVARHRCTLMRGGRGETDSETVQETHFESAIVCPLIVNERFIGTLGLYHAEAERYTADHRRLLEQISEQVAAVIHNSIIFEQTQVDSVTDPLTGLPNRRPMFAHMTRELARADRLKGQVAVIVMDIDDFKRINDTYGHHVGDRALRDMAAALHASLRPYDLCVRYAGDEFVIVLSDCSRDAAEAKRRELQQRVSEIEVEIEARPGERVRLAASAGASVYPHDGSTCEALLADADLRMYRDKALRRGQLPPVPMAAPAPEIVPDPAARPLRGRHHEAARPRR